MSDDFMGTDESEELDDGFGHNSKNAATLRSYISRIEGLEEEKAELAQDIRDIYKEAKQNNFNPTVMRAIIRLRKADQEKQKEFENALDLYKHAMGMEQ